jgi:hypothetical protein
MGRETAGSFGMVLPRHSYQIEHPRKQGKYFLKSQRTVHQMEHSDGAKYHQILFSESLRNKKLDVGRSGVVRTSCLRPIWRPENNSNHIGRYLKVENTFRTSYLPGAH